MLKRNILIAAIWSLVFVFSGVPSFAQQVDTAWVRRYNGPGNSYDYAYAIAVDISGNVCVTGYSYGIDSDRDYATIMYYPDGDTAWARRYNGPSNYWDMASATAIDDSGYVYVTGESYGIGTSTDYATIKYYPDGDSAWVRRYDGPGNGSDRAGDLAVDDSGYVYVTGGSDGIGKSTDYATIKYYPNGDIAWVRRYNGPADSSDYASAIAIDVSGNIYVTGASWGDETDWDYVTIKYHANGDTAWVSRYDGPISGSDAARAIAVDDSGYVYVTGTSDGIDSLGDYATIKYYPNGDTAWVSRYSGPADTAGYARAIDLDTSGNVYVTGGFGAGWPLTDYFTIKYYPDGDTAWVRRYNGSGNGWDNVSALSVDAYGNVYATGWSYGGTNLDYATIQYYPNGEIVWEARYNNLGTGGDLAYAIALGDSGNVYVTGASLGSGTEVDYATIKYIQFLCGDVNKDGAIDIADVVYLINYLFANGPAPTPWPSGDVNCDGGVNIADAIYLVNYLFLDGPPPCEP